MRLLLFIALFATSVGMAQTTQNVCKKVDPFDDSVSYSGISEVLYADGKDMRTEGLIFYIYPTERGKKIVPSIIMKAAGMDKCVDEGSTLNIIFENGEKIEMVNWNDFDCDGTNYFRMPTDRGELYLLETEPIKGMRYRNSRDYQSYTVLENMTDEAKTMFIGVLADIKAINDGTADVPLCED